MALGCKQVLHHRSSKLSLKLLLHKSWPGCSPQAHALLQDSTFRTTPLGPSHQGRWNVVRTVKSCILAEVNTDLSVTIRVQEGSLAELPWRLEVAPKVDILCIQLCYQILQGQPQRQERCPIHDALSKERKKTGDFLFGESHHLCRRLEEHSTYGERKKRFGAKEYSGGMGRYWPTEGHRCIGK